MGQIIKGKFVNGKVELLERSDLEEGEDVVVVVPFRPKQEWEEGYDGWEEVLGEIYERRRRAYLESREVIEEADA